MTLFRILGFLLLPLMPFVDHLVGNRLLPNAREYERKLHNGEYSGRQEKQARMVLWYLESRGVYFPSDTNIKEEK